MRLRALPYHTKSTIKKDNEMNNITYHIKCRRIGFACRLHETMDLEVRTRFSDTGRTAEYQAGSFLGISHTLTGFQQCRTVLVVGQSLECLVNGSEA